MRSLLEVMRCRPVAQTARCLFNPNAEEHEFDPAQGRKRQQFEYVIGPAQRPAHVVPPTIPVPATMSMSVRLTARRLLAQVNQLERYPPESNSANPRQATPPA